MNRHVLAVLALLAAPSSAAVTAEAGTTQSEQRTNLTRRVERGRLHADACAYVRSKGATGCRRGRFHPKREGFHVCQQGSSSGFTVEIDRCWVSGQRDPADVRSRYTHDRWRADKGWVGMRFTRCYFPHQCRSQTNSLTLGVAGWVTRHSTRG